MTTPDEPVTPPREPSLTGPPLAAGERVVLVDSRGRRYRFKLAAGGQFHSHAGALEHDQLIGLVEGTEVRGASGARYVVLRPTMSDHVLKMPRGAQVIYPKDLAPMVWGADVQAGDLVFESGVGSGALSAALLRAGAQVVGYELRDDFAQQAMANVESILGAEVMPNYTVEVRDAYEAVELAPQPNPGVEQDEAAGEPLGRAYDAALLDIPEPWQVVPHLLTSLRPGGRLVAYNPSITQVIRLREVLAERDWTMVETTEVLHRGWHIKGQAARPDHRMVAHTGFITHARRLNT